MGSNPTNGMDVWCVCVFSVFVFGRLGEEKILSPRDSNPYPSVVQPVANRYTDCPIPAPIYSVKWSKFTVEDIEY
jgi:hypothetical protein